MQQNFTSERLQLDLIKENDYLFIKNLVNTEGWLHFIGNRNVNSDDDAIKYIHKLIATPQLYYWVIKLKNYNVPIGIISFMKRANLDHYDIGFALLPNYVGHGYAYEAASTILNYVVEIVKIKPIIATTLPANNLSIKLLHKLGLTYRNEITSEQDILHVYST